MSAPITIDDVQVILTQPGNCRLAIVKVVTSEPGITEHQGVTGL